MDFLVLMEVFAHFSPSVCVFRQYTIAYFSKIYVPVCQRSNHFHFEDARQLDFNLILQINWPLFFCKWLNTYYFLKKKQLTFVDRNVRTEYIANILNLLAFG